MKLSILVGEFRSLLRGLGSVVNTQTSEVSYRYIGVRLRGGVLSLMGCSKDMMAYVEFGSGHSTVKFEGDEGDSFLLDLSYFNKFLQSFPEQALFVVTHLPHGGSLKVTCGEHRSEHSLNLEAQINDLWSPVDFGGVVDESWDRYNFPLDEILKRVEFAMLKRDQISDFDESQLAAVRLTFKGDDIQVEATDNKRFAHYREPSVSAFSPADFLLSREVVTQIHRHGFTQMQSNGHAFCFRGGKMGVDLYSRALGEVSEFPNLEAVFGRFRTRKGFDSVIVKKEDLQRILQRQVFLSEQVGDTHSLMEWKPSPAGGGEVVFSVPKIGRDSLKYEFEVGSRPLSVRVDPAHLLSCVGRLDFPRLSLVVHQQKNLALVGFRPVEVDFPPPPPAMLHPDQIDIGSTNGFQEGFAEGAEFFFVSSAITTKF